MNPKSEVLASKIVLAAWCIFWCGFAVLSGLTDKSSTVSALPYVAGFCGVMLLLTAVGLRADRFAVVTLSLTAIVIAVGYPLMALGRFGWNTILFMEAALALPPAIAAALILHSRS